MPCVHVRGAVAVAFAVKLGRDVPVAGRFDCSVSIGRTCTEQDSQSTALSRLSAELTIYSQRDGCYDLSPLVVQAVEVGRSREQRASSRRQSSVAEQARQSSCVRCRIMREHNESKSISSSHPSAVLAMPQILLACVTSKLQLLWKHLCHQETHRNAKQWISSLFATTYATQD